MEIFLNDPQKNVLSLEVFNSISIADFFYLTETNLKYVLKIFIQYDIFNFELYAKKLIQNDFLSH